MPKQTLNKTIAARKLHHRTLTPLAEPEVTIPFGAILDNPHPDRDTMVFYYLTEPYACPLGLFQSAIASAAAPKDAPPQDAPQPSAAIETPRPKLQFEALSSNVAGLSRAKVPGGWLVANAEGGVIFYPDAKHVWNGESLA